MTDYVPTKVNVGSFLTAYTLPVLRERVRNESIVLPICSLQTPPQELANLGSLILPPLYHEGLDEPLKAAIIERVRLCFPYFVGTRARSQSQAHVEVVELPRRELKREASPRVLAFSVDTAVEQHGPHLPLATDTIQSYAVLTRLAAETQGFKLLPPLDYGQLTWGLPLGMSIDITPPLLTRYVKQFVDAICDWLSPAAIYVVDVHGSGIHRTAIQEGLAASRCQNWAFRWLYEPLLEFSLERRDMHAGGVETAIVEHVRRELVDATWWPGRVADLAAEQMSLVTVLDLAQDLSRFIQYAETSPWNGIVGDIHNYFRLHAASLLEKMLAVARRDLEKLINPGSTNPAPSN